MEKKFVILGHKNPDIDSIVSGILVESILKKKGYDGEFIIPCKTIEEKTVELLKKYGVDTKLYQKELPREAHYILVDHHERKVNGDILAIIDHHPAEKEIKVPFYQNERSSSAALLLAKANESILEKKELELALLATFVDTACFRSNKTLEGDKEWVEKCALKHGIDSHSICKDGLMIDSLVNLTEASFNGYKQYEGAYKIESSTLQLMGDYHYEVAEMLSILKEHVKQSQLDLFVFIIHNLKDVETVVYLLTKGSTRIVEYPGYISRGDTVMPEIERALQKDPDKILRYKRPFNSEDTFVNGTSI